MGERAWLLRDAARRILDDAPLPPATWLSVARRSLVIVGCFVAGIAVGDVHAGVLAAFGALQVALVEAAVPLRTLTRLVVTLTVGCVVTAFIALLIGGTAWAVLALAALAYVFGATGALSAYAMTVGISALAVGVIFAGMPASSPALALQGALTIGVGILAQSVAWLVVWRPERDRFIRHALANKLRTDVRLLREPTIDVAALIKTHAQVDVVQAAITAAGLRPDADDQARRVLTATVELTRAIIAWIVVEAPGEGDRIALGVRLQHVVRRLESPRRTRVSPVVDASASDAIEAALRRLDDAIDAGSSDTEHTQLAASAMRTAPPPRADAHAVARALWPGAVSRHGLRMAIGIGLAEALSIALPVAHSFWLPLTVVFTLRADWAFTVIRGVTRTVGNLAAVVILPAVLLALGGNDAAIAAALAVLSAITFRTFYGNYAIASFGLAGTVLLLDSTIVAGDDLFVVRIVAAILGALISLAVAFALPAWSSANGPDQVRALDDVVRRWRDLVERHLADRTAVTDAELDAANAAARRALLLLDQTSTGALLEPNRDPRSIALALVTAAGIHEVAALVAVSVVATAPTTPEAAADLLVRARLRQTGRAFDDAVAAYAAR